MKKIYFFFLLSILSLAVNAQIKKGSTLLGGQLFYVNTKNEPGNSSQRNSTASITLSAGKAFRENKVIGITAGLTPERQKNQNNGPDLFNRKANSYLLGIFYREYKTLGKGFYFFGQADAAFFASNQTQTQQVGANNWKVTQKGVSINITPGLSYQLFRKMQAEISIPNLVGLSYSNRKEYRGVNFVETFKNRQFSFSSNLSTQLGLMAVGFRFIL